MLGYNQLMVASMISFPIPDWADPRSWLGEAVRSFRESVVQLVESYLANPPRVSDTSFVEGLYQVALAPAPMLAWVVVVFAIVIAVVTFRSTGRVIYAFVVLFVAIAVAPIYHSLLNHLMRIGDDLTTAASGLVSYSSSQPLASIGNPLFDLVSFGLVALGGFAVLMYLYGAVPAYVMATFLLPLAFAVSALGPRTRNVANFFASVTIVMALIGRPIAVLSIELFQVINMLQPGSVDVVFMQNLVMATSFAVTLILQVVLIAVTYVGINNVQGAIATRISQLPSRMRTSVSNTVKIRKDQTSTKPSRPMPVVVTNPSIAKHSNIKTEVSRRASSGLVNLGIKVAVGAATTAATRNPKLGAAAAKVATLKKRLKI